jgi:hypothetical protein
MLSNYAGQTWLDGLNGTLYFPVVLTIDTLLIVWFLLMARQAGEDKATNGAPQSKVAQRQYLI